MQIRQSAEDYFEMIYMLKKKNGSVRAIDIVNEMGFSKPTVSVAMKKFRENGFVTVDADGNISLTETGQAIAEKTYEKHMVLARMLMILGVNERTAYEDACRIEHCLSDESFDAIKKHMAEAHQ
ncbi:metal-dependent transcriptional regulator [Ihubacter sp. rT4E-8]|uniref:metal-dependent transcriptional regulator n=1 Tax=unclassified Ihubacter TaxID=2633299 RepID=UPI0013794AC8